MGEVDSSSPRQGLFLGLMGWAYTFGDKHNPLNGSLYDFVFTTMTTSLLKSHNPIGDLYDESCMHVVFMAFFSHCFGL